jgi:hypothetical protein
LTEALRPKVSGKITVFLAQGLWPPPAFGSSVGSLIWPTAAGKGRVSGSFLPQVKKQQFSVKK